MEIISFFNVPRFPKYHCFFWSFPGFFRCPFHEEEFWDCMNMERRWHDTDRGKWIYSGKTSSSSSFSATYPTWTEAGFFFACNSLFNLYPVLHNAWHISTISGSYRNTAIKYRFQIWREKECRLTAVFLDLLVVRCLKLVKEVFGLTYGILGW